MTDPGGPRLTSVPGLDVVLGAGLTEGELVFIVGAPGVGKTVLASQILFTAARDGLSSLIFTTYSESHVKLLEHLRSFDFFDESLIGDRITLLALPSLIGSEPSSAATIIARTIRESGVKFVLIDGFQGISALLPEPHALRQLLAALGSQLSYLGATVLVTFAGSIQNSITFPEFTTADTIINLAAASQRHLYTRCLEVIKRRGHAQLTGDHGYIIDSRGMTVLPRLESYPIPASGPYKTGRVTFGLPELDEMLGGGLTACSSTILAGGPGTGKTTLALYWALNDARPDNKTLYVSFRERAPQLEEKARAFGFDLEGAIASGALEILRFEPVELNPDLVAQQILNRLVEDQIQRFVFDDVNHLAQTLGSRATEYFAALAAHLYGDGVTSLILMGTAPFTGFHLDLTAMPAAVLGENLMMIQQIETDGKLRRLMAVLRMRFSDYDQTLRELVLNTQGIRVLGHGGKAKGKTATSRRKPHSRDAL